MSQSSEPVHEFLAMQARGLLALPAALRKRYGLDRPGAQVELTERADGVIELRPQVAVPATQAWFWESAWQRRELEVEQHVAAGAVTVHADTEQFLAHLDRLDAVENSQTG